jgi:nucleotide-binding universal stress UspA family protein
MYKKILVPTDGSKLSLKAAAAAVELAKSQGASVVGFYAGPEYPVAVYGEGVLLEPQAPKAYKEEVAKLAAKYLGQIEKKANEVGVAFEATHTLSSNPWEAIIAAARRKKCDLIFMASHGRRGVSALLLGSETQKVLTHSKVPVLVYR